MATQSCMEWSGMQSMMQVETLLKREEERESETGFQETKFEREPWGGRETQRGYWMKERSFFYSSKKRGERGSGYGIPHASGIHYMLLFFCSSRHTCMHTRNTDSKDRKKQGSRQCNILHRWIVIQLHEFGRCMLYESSWVKQSTVYISADTWIR